MRDRALNLVFHRTEQSFRGTNFVQKFGSEKTNDEFATFLCKFETLKKGGKMEEVDQNGKSMEIRRRNVPSADNNGRLTHKALMKIAIFIVIFQLIL